MKKKKNKRKIVKKPVEKICKNCLIYDAQAGVCRATILMEGKKINLPMYPTDPCFFQQETIFKDENGEEIDRWTPEIQQVKMWVENPKTGQKCKNGIVKIEYPPDFFGTDINELLET